MLSCRYHTINLQKNLIVRYHHLPIDVIIAKFTKNVGSFYLNFRCYKLYFVIKGYKSGNEGSGRPIERGLGESLKVHKVVSSNLTFRTN